MMNAMALLCFLCAKMAVVGPIPFMYNLSMVMINLHVVKMAFARSKCAP